MKKNIWKNVIIGSLTCCLPLSLSIPYFVKDEFKSISINKELNLEFINELEKNSNRDFIKSKENINLIEDYIKSSVNAKIVSKEANLDNNVNEFVLEESLSYLKKYENNQFGINDLLDIANKNDYSLNDIKNDIDNYKENVYANNNNNSILKNKRSSSIEEISYILESMKEAGINSASFGAASLALAAGYWAASWFFGITIASAIAATVQSVAFFAESGVYFGIYYANINDPKYTSIKTIEAIENVGNLVWVKDVIEFPKVIREWVNSIKSVINTIKIASIGLKSTIIATSWASPVGLMFLATSEIAISICDLVINAPWS